MSSTNAAYQSTLDVNSEFHPNGPTIIIHKDGEEGAILIDQTTGAVLLGQQDKPEWSEGLMAANLVERHTFYLTALGPDNFKADMQVPVGLDMADLGWVAWDQEQQEVEIEADAEFRSNRIRDILVDLGIVAVDAATGEDIFTAGESIMLDTDSRRTPEQVSALDRAQEQGFAAIQEKERKVSNG